jgi:hypothetical protein
VVAVPDRPRGLPTASTGSPTPTASESPRVAGDKSSGASSTRTTARSVVASAPTTSASRIRPSLSVSSTSCAPSTTWLLVSTCPSASRTTPDPPVPPRALRVSMDTTESSTTPATAFQSGPPTEPLWAGTMSGASCPTSVSDGVRPGSSSRSVTAPAAAPADRTAAIAATLTIGTHGMLRSAGRTVGCTMGCTAVRSGSSIMTALLGLGADDGWSKPRPCAGSEPS